jgi:hypothetical protein
MREPPIGSEMGNGGDQDGCIPRVTLIDLVRYRVNNPKQNRGRHRNNARRSNPSRQNFDSNGPGVRVRGNATQIYEKYIQLARDAQSAGDRVMAENMLQHAEHYFRVLNENNPDRGREQSRQQDQASDQQPDMSSDDERDQIAQSGEADEGADRDNGRARRPRNGGGRGGPRRRNGRGGDESADDSEAGGAEASVESSAQSELPISAD